MPRKQATTNGIKRRQGERGKGKPKPEQYNRVSLSDPDVRGRFLIALEARGGKLKETLDDFRIKEPTFWSYRAINPKFSEKVTKAVYRGKKYQREIWWMTRASVLDKLLIAVNNTDPNDLKLNAQQMISLFNALQEKAPQVQVNQQINNNQKVEKVVQFNLKGLSDEELAVIEKLHATQALPAPSDDAVDTGETPAVEYAEYETITENPPNDESPA